MAKIRWDCKDCSKSTFDDYYMVKDEIWAEAGMPAIAPRHDTGMLHRACLEKRIGRPLTLDDYTDYPVNNWIREGLDRFEFI